MPTTSVPPDSSEAQKTDVEIVEPAKEVQVHEKNEPDVDDKPTDIVKNEKPPEELNRRLTSRTSAADDSNVDKFCVKFPWYRNDNWSTVNAPFRHDSSATAACHFTCPKEGKVLDLIAVGKKKRKDELSSYKIEVTTKQTSQKVVREVKDPFAGRVMAFLSSSILCFSSWEMTSKDSKHHHGPVIRTFDVVSSSLGPTLSTQDNRKSTSKLSKHVTAAGGLYQNFNSLTPFAYNGEPMLFAASEEGLMCIWKVSFLCIDSKSDNIKCLKQPSKRGKAPLSGTLVASTIIAVKDTFVGDRFRLLGASLSSNFSKVYAVDRFWRVWIWDWTKDLYRVIPLGNIMKSVVPVMGCGPKANSSKFRDHKNPTVNSTITEEFVPLEELELPDQADWLVRPKAIKIIVTEDLDSMIVGTLTSVLDEDQAKEKDGGTLQCGTLYPDTWKLNDWILQFNLKQMTLSSIAEGWYPHGGLYNDRNLICLTAREADIQFLNKDSKKRKNRRGVLLLRKSDLCTVSDSRAFTEINRYPIRKIVTHSYPCLGLTNGRKPPTRKKSKRDEGDEQPGSWFNLNYFKTRKPVSDTTSGNPVWFFDGTGQGAMVEVFGV